MIDEGLFHNLYAQVCTRCFGYGLPGTSMVPMADNINHSDINAVNEIIQKEFHPKATFRSDGYFRKTKFMNDYSHLYSEQELAQLDEQGKKNVYGRFNRELFEKN